jgi:hypothetical protein
MEASMKFKVHIKDPDGFYDAINDAVKEQLQALSLPDDEKGALHYVKSEKVASFLKQWVKYGECMVVEFDTETNSATVLRR